MKSTIIIVALAVLGAGCQSWPNERFEVITGVPVSDGISLCSTASVKEREDCVPDHGGLSPWNRVTNVTTLKLDAGMDSAETAQYVASRYLGHVFRNDVVLIGCPTVNPFTDTRKAEYADYFVSYGPIVTSLATVYSEVAIQDAKASIKASARASGQPAISAEGMARFDTALRRVFSEEGASNAKVVYVQAVMPSGLEEVPARFPEYAKCLEGFDAATDSVITGVTGFFLEEFSQSTRVYSEEMFTAAIEAAIKASPRATDKSTFDTVKGEASANWAMSVNRKLEQLARLESYARTFHPIWIRFDVPPDHRRR